MKKVYKCEFCKKDILLSPPKNESGSHWWEPDLSVFNLMPNKITHYECLKNENSMEKTKKQNPTKCRRK